MNFYLSCDAFLSLCQDPLINNNWKLFKGHFDPVWSEFVAGKIRYISQHVWPCSSSISWHLGNFFTELVTWHPSATQAFPHTLQNNLLPRQRQFDENSFQYCITVENILLSIFSEQWVSKADRVYCRKFWVLIPMNLWRTLKADQCICWWNV